MRNTRGKVQEYLSMTLDLQTPGDFREIMVDYLKWVLEDFPEVITGGSTILVAKHLFQVRSEDKRNKLDEERET